MKLLHLPTKARAVSLRLLLTAAIIGGGIVALPHAGFQGVAQAAGLATSAKPDSRGLDQANTGDETALGPVNAPTQIFNANIGSGFIVQGLELDGNSNLIFSASVGTSGVMYSYNTATQTANWSTTLPAGATFGNTNNATCPPSNPVVSSDGNIYAGADNGKLYQFNTSTGTSAVAFSNASGKPMQQTPKIGTDNSIYVGDGAGKFYHLAAPGTLPTTAIYTFSANGNTTNSADGGPFKFCGEPAVDANGVAWVASIDTNQNTSVASLGTLYGVSTAGAALYNIALQGAPSGAVMLATNPANGHKLAIVTDNAPEVLAVDTTNGSVVWDYAPGGNPIVSSPALSKDGNSVYAIDNSSSLFALNIATGSLNTSFGTSGTVSIANGSQASPIVDGNGNIYVEGNDGRLYGYSSTGTQLWNVAPGIATGQSGSQGSKWFSPAIDNNLTIYAGGKNGLARGFQDSQNATATAAAAAATAAAQQTANAAATQTAVALATANANANNTATAVAQQTANAVATATAAAQQTATAAAQQTANAAATATAAAQQTATQVAINNATSTAIAQATATAVAQQTATSQAATATAVAAAQATAIANGKVPNGQLYVLPNPETVQEGGSEAVLYKALPGTTITTTINANDTYPLTATLYTGAPNSPGVVITAVNTGGQNYQFVFTTGSNGRALIDFNIPASGPVGKPSIQTTAVEASDHKTALTSLVHFNVEAPQVSSFGNTVKLERHGIVFRTVELPTHVESVVDNKIHVVTAPGAVVTITEAISGSVSSLGTAADGGTAFTNGQVFYQTVQTASATGGVFVTIPATTSLLIPGKGGVIKVTVQSQTGNIVSTYKTSVKAREIRLRLVIQPQETTRGNKNQVFQFGHLSSGSSTFTALVLCDGGAHITSTATINGDAVNASGTCSANGRVKLHFSFPNSLAPTSGTHHLGSLSVTSTFRGATITRTINFTYGSKKH